MIDHVGEKGAVMADQEERFLRISEIVLEPTRRLEIEVIRRLVQKQDIGGTHKLPRQPNLPRSPPLNCSSGCVRAFSASKPRPCSTASTRGAKYIPLLDRTARDPDRTWRAAAAWQLSPTCGQHVRLFRQRALEREEIGELARSRFPNRLGAPKITVLFEESQAKARLTGHRAFSGLLRSRDQPEKGGLAAPIPAQDGPSLSFSDREGYSLKYSRRAKFDAGIRDRYLGQARRTLEHAARQRSTDSTSVITHVSDAKRRALELSVAASDNDSALRDCGRESFPPELRTEA